VARQGAHSVFSTADGPIVPLPDDCAMTTAVTNAIEAITPHIQLTRRWSII